MSINLEGMSRSALEGYVRNLKAALEGRDEAATSVRAELRELHKDMDAHDLFAAPAYRLGRILDAWERQP